ncbi:TonB-dependent receptor [Catenovulum adriaticum]|uniref:TonB-dependent receptor n=1 Tax=Catenovulum adriaticum TaxID=2984846 RepID=A0ABY7AR07_9ALTE|nr:TonB-dependent receptor [Catenovulum sp. TS8]WAJ71919.1 TonB-dependent receptor [Catenovulum sp. TS8]
MAHKRNEQPKFRKTLLTLAVIGLVSPVYAAEESSTQAEDEDLETIEVTGIRQSFQTALSIKRNADTVVDSISATDIGSLPDASVLESLARVPGVSIDQFASPNDADNFSAQGSNAVVRGMTQTRSEFNGRDTFSATSGRGLSYSDVPATLMAGIDVYKNQTADMMEGGIAGTISLRTRKPFDSRGERISVAAEAVWGDLARDIGPSYSGLYSNRWETDSGHWGFLINASSSEITTEAHGMQTRSYDFYSVDDYADYLGDYDGLYHYTGTLADIARRGESHEHYVEPDTYGALVPLGGSASMRTNTRKRIGMSSALQWKTLDESVKATLEYIRSDSDSTSRSHVAQFGAGMGTYFMAPQGDDAWNINEQGLFESGTFTYIEQQYAMGGRIPTWSQALTDSIPGYENADNTIDYGPRTSATSGYGDSDSLVEDLSLNVKWLATDALELEFDVQHVKASSDSISVGLEYQLFANQTYDIIGNGDTPTLKMESPWSSTDPEQLAYYQQQGLFEGHDNYFTKKSSYYWRSASDNFQDNDGTSDAIKLDAKYYLDTNFFSTVKVGVRWREREQINRKAAYNWGSLKAEWSSLQSGTLYEELKDKDNFYGGTGWLDGAISEAAGMDSEYDVLDWSNFHRGGVLQIGENNVMLHPSYDLLTNYTEFSQKVRTLAESCGQFKPTPYRTDPTIEGVDYCEPYSDLDGYFRDNEISTTIETNKSAYVRLDFDSDIGDHRFTGNIGLRYVEVENKSQGFITFPRLPVEAQAPEGWEPGSDLSDMGLDLVYDDVAFLDDPYNFLPNEVKEFADGSYSQSIATKVTKRLLPSFNIKAEITNDLIARLAISKAIALPDIGDLRNTVNIGRLQYSYNFERMDPVYSVDNPHPDAPADSTTGLPQDPDTGVDLTEKPQIRPGSVDFGGWTGSAGNPYLLPMESNQLDLTLEWYYDKDGALTSTFFYKDLSNFFIKGAYNAEFTNPTTGVKQSVIVEGPTNGGDGTMKGLELSYKQFFKSLPAPFDGFGVHANYSFIKAEGVPNSNLDSGAIGAADGNGEALDQFKGTLPLRGQSDHTYNLIGIYEKNGWSARLAYKWRSEFLLSSKDNKTELPIYNGDDAQLDASVTYKFKNGIKIGLQAVNVTAEPTKTNMQVDENLKLGRSWFTKDRRIKLLMRATF